VFRSATDPEMDYDMVYSIWKHIAGVTAGI